ncbi:MAG: M56 family metallopeptidase, partial [Gemmatimonadaceae bacterium]
MTLAWMLYALGVGALIAIAAVSAEWVLKSAQRSVRFVWTTAIALTVVFTVVAPWRVPRPQLAFRLPVSLVETPMVAAIQPTLLAEVIANSRAALALLTLPAQKSMTWAMAAPRIANVSAGAFWVLSAVFALVVLLTAYSRSMRESRRWPLLNVLGRNVRVAPDVGPAVLGIAPPEIVIPRWVLQRNTEEQHLVLAHESEHVRAHDPLLLVLACIAVALMPWNAAVWFMWSRLRLAVELDCDQRVLLRGVQKPAYGALLVELSSRRPWNSLAMPAFSWGTSQLEKRLVAMTARPVRFRVARRVASAGVIAIALVAACNSEMPTAAQVQAMDVSALAARMPLTDTTLYFVNTRPVSKAEATAIAADDISSVNVQRASKTNPVAKIHVTLVTDSMRKLRVGSRLDSSRKGEPRDAQQEALKMKPAVTVQGDTIIVLNRTTRDPSFSATGKSSAYASAEKQRLANGESVVVTDSSVAHVSGAKIVLRGTDCGAEGTLTVTSAP